MEKWTIPRAWPMVNMVAFCSGVHFWSFAWLQYIAESLVFIRFVGNEDKFPKRPRKIICLVSDLSAQQVFWRPYLLTPWHKLGLPHVQNEAIVETHNFGIQTFAIRGHLGHWICTERSCCLWLREYLSGWVDLVGKHPSPRSFIC
jgi:hypothetical protein